jgi:site-specific recombinase XerD
MNTLTCQFSAYLLQHGRVERTAAAYVSDVERYIGWCEREYGQVFSVSMLNRSDLHDYQVACRKVERAKAATWNRYMASLAVFAAWANVDIADAMTRAESQKLAPKSLSKPDYKRFRLAVSEAVRTAKSEAAKRLAARNAAVVTLLADAGLREGEIVHLRVQDVLLGERKGRVIILDAKGNKDRTVPLDKDSVDTIKAWLAVRPGQGDDALFVGKFGDKLQERGIQKMVAGIAQDAGIGHVTPHQLRHSTAYRLIKAGATLTEVAEILGHGSIDVTRRYTLPHWEDLEDLVEMA